MNSSLIYIRLSLEVTWVREGCFQVRSGYLCALQTEDWIVDTQVAIDPAGHSAIVIHCTIGSRGKLKRGRYIERVEEKGRGRGKC